MTVGPSCSPSSPSRSPGRSVSTSPRKCGGDHLDDIFAEPCSRMMQWRKDSIQASNAEVQKGMKDLYRERLGLDDLRAELATLKKEREDALKLRAAAESAGEQVRQRSEAAAKRAEGVLRTKDVLLKARADCERLLAQERDALDISRAEAEARSAEVESLLSLYNKQLGLAVTREGPQTVRMVFTLIDNASPLREFSFKLGLGSLLEYKVCDCSPQVPDLSERVADLNATGHLKSALPVFLCGMRRAFQDLVLQH